MKLGILGGSFNPIHKCHLSVARAARSCVGLDRILFIPTGDPPHKPPGSFASAHHRLRMVELAIQDDEGFSASDLELRRPGKSYTIDTLRALLPEQEPGTELFFIVGLDAFLDVPSWKESDTLLSLCHFIVISRPATSFQSLTKLPAFKTTSVATLAALDAGTQTRADLPLSSRSTLILLKLPRATYRPPKSELACGSRHRWQICCPSRSNLIY